MRDEEAHKVVESLYRRFAPYVGSIACRILGRQSEAEELVQEVFITAYRSIDQLRDEQAAQKWLSVITVRLARRRLKIMKFKSWLGMQSDDEAYDLSLSASTPEQATLISQASKVLESMPGDWRLCWVLKRIEGYSLDEISEASGVSPATVKRYVAYAQTQLKESLDEH